MLPLVVIARDSQFLHARLKRGSFHAQTCGGAADTSNNAPGLP